MTTQLTRKQESWSPFRDLSQEFENLTQRFHRFFGMPSVHSSVDREPLTSTDWAPSVNISETEKEYRIRAELPEVRKEDVHVSLEEGELTIQGERREDREEKGAKFHRRELMYGQFLRRFTMPEDADESKVDASFKDGILTVTINKSKTKAAAGRQITIH
jgi:HSP20 family protein